LDWPSTRTRIGLVSLQLRDASESVHQEIHSPNHLQTLFTATHHPPTPKLSKKNPSIDIKHYNSDSIPNIWYATDPKFQFNQKATYIFRRPISNDIPFPIHKLISSTYEKHSWSPSSIILFLPLEFLRSYSLLNIQRFWSNESLLDVSHSRLGKLNYIFFINTTLINIPKCAALFLAYSKHFPSLHEDSRRKSWGW
jgi:hypothetical protein